MRHLSKVGNKFLIILETYHWRVYKFFFFLQFYIPTIIRGEEVQAIIACINEIQKYSRPNIVT